MILFIVCAVSFIASWTYVLWPQRPRVDASRDLREVYPPVRDEFHRDLERLNQLRGKPADTKSSLSSRHDVGGGCTIVHAYVQLPDGSIVRWRPRNQVRQPSEREQVKLGSRSSWPRKVVNWLDTPPTTLVDVVAILFVLTALSLGLCIASLL